MRKMLAVAVLVAGSILPAAGLGAETLGRLFFTPAQRDTLDAGKQIGTPRSSRAPAARGPREVTLNGVVTRSDGESTVWVNGRALDKRPAAGVSATASASDPAAARVKLGGARNTVRMRVGQRLRPSTGKIAEPYESSVGRKTAPTPVSKERDAAAHKKQAPSNPEPPEQASDD